MAKQNARKAASKARKLKKTKRTSAKRSSARKRAKARRPVRRDKVSEPSETKEEVKPVVVEKGTIKLATIAAIIGAIAATTTIVRFATEYFGINLTGN